VIPATRQDPRRARNELGLVCFDLSVAAWGTDFGSLNIKIQPLNPKIGSSSLEPRWVFSPPKLLLISKSIFSRLMLYVKLGLVKFIRNV